MILNKKEVNLKRPHIIQCQLKNTREDKTLETAQRPTVIKSLREMNRQQSSDRLQGSETKLCDNNSDRAFHYVSAWTHQLHTTKNDAHILFLSLWTYAILTNVMKYLCQLNLNFFDDKKLWTLLETIKTVEASSYNTHEMSQIVHCSVCVSIGCDTALTLCCQCKVRAETQRLFWC